VLDRREQYSQRQFISRTSKLLPFVALSLSRSHSFADSSSCQTHPAWNRRRAAASEEWLRFITNDPDQQPGLRHRLRRRRSRPTCSAGVLLLTTLGKDSARSHLY
jgi:hypothetical protein